MAARPGRLDEFPLPRSRRLCVQPAGSLLGDDLGQRRPQPFLTVPPPPQLPARLALAGGVLGGVLRGGLGDDLIDLLPQPLAAATGMPGRVRSDLGTVDRDRAQPSQLRPVIETGATAMNTILKRQKNTGSA